MAFTVTATQGGSTFAGIALAVKVLTGAVEAGGAHNHYFSSSTGPAAASITPAFSNSLPVFATAVDTATAFTAATNNTYWDNSTAPFGVGVGDGRYTGAVSAGTPVTCGSSAPTTSSLEYQASVYEIPPSGGSTPVLDGSTPAWATTSSAITITTASFTPPAGSVLVALITCFGSASGSGLTMSVTDTAGLGLIWTQREGTGGNASPSEGTFIFTATMPGGAAGGPAPVTQRQQRRRYRTRARRRPWQQTMSPPSLVVAGTVYGVNGSSDTTASMGGDGSASIPTSAAAYADMAGAPGVGAVSTSATVTGKYSQPPSAGNTLVAMLAENNTLGTTSAFTQHAGTSGWTQIQAVAHNGMGNTHYAHVEVWTKTAAGNDAAPVFDVPGTGTLISQCTIYELWNAGAVDVTGNDQSGASAVSLTSMSITTGNVNNANEFAISVRSMISSAANWTNAYVKGASMDANGSVDGVATVRGHMAVDHDAGPAVGAPLVDACSGTNFIGYTAGAMVVFSPGPATTYTPGQTSLAGPLAAFNASGLTTLNVVPRAIGDLLVAGVKLTSGTISCTGITGTGTAGWTRVAGPYYDAGSPVRSQEIWIGQASAVGATTLTFTFSSSNAGIATDLECQMFTTGKSFTSWSRDGTQTNSQANAASTIVFWPGLTATNANDLFVGTARVPGGGYYSAGTSGYIASRDTNSNPSLFRPNLSSGAISGNQVADTVSVASYTLSVLLDPVDVWPVAGDSAADMAAVGVIGTASGMTGTASSAPALDGDGVIVQTLATSGSSAGASPAAGTVVLQMAVAGSSATAQAAVGVIGAGAGVNGTSTTGPTAAGAIGQILAVAASAFVLAHCDGTVVQTMLAAGSSAGASHGDGAVGQVMPLAGSSAGVSSGAGAVTILIGATVWVAAGSSATSSAGDGTISATLVLSGTAVAVSSGSGAIGKLAPLSGSAASVVSGNGTITATLLAAGSSAGAVTAAGTVSATLAVAGPAVAASSASGAIGRFTPLAGSASGVSTGTGAIVQITAVAGSATGVVSGAGTIFQTLIVAGSSASTSSASGAIGRFSPLAGSAAGTSSSTGAIIMIAAVAGSAAGASLGTGTITQTAIVAGSASTASSGSGTVTRVTPLAGSAASASHGDGAVTIHAGAIVYDVAGSAAVVASGTGTIVQTMVLSGSAAGASSAAGTLGLRAVAVGSSVTVSSAAGTLAQTMAIAGGSAGSSTASGALGAALGVAGSAASVSHGDGAVSVAAHLLMVAGSSAGVSTASGVITAAGAAVGSSLTASAASGTVSAQLAVSGAARAVSVASGALGTAGAVAGSAATASGAAGTVYAWLAVSGLSLTVSGADGAIQPPFTAGAMPDVITAIVTVTPGPRATIGVNPARVTIEVQAAPAGVVVNRIAGSSVTINRAYAEVT